ncbi:hypothetical protein BDK51DRAFT_44282 [Blyttiomyces helicus]|uniref:Histidine phosphatase superfamily n=1 Tax=Blyttiomyces helicus TaxID=388810 RepID=A0A4P9VZV6_9FUNG|nr:hypothetical protein BDK51DRAFT_44282 [Blyttiomyces helicus]|eukprot:RKO85371.1 hypothetical protein BDK51DRAFT_44282 [Blyttiomyces helicus]
MGCSLLTTVVRNMEAAIASPDTAPRTFAAFSHAETIIPLIASLGLVIKFNIAHGTKATSSTVTSNSPPIPSIGAKEDASRYFTGPSISSPPRRFRLQTPLSL